MSGGQGCQVHQRPGRPAPGLRTASGHPAHRMAACGGELVGLQQRDDGTGGDGLDTPVVEQKFTLRNKHGFHARAATRFVQLVNRYSARIEVEKDGQSQDGRSVLGMLMLLAGRGASITVRCHGDDAAEVLQAIHDLIEDGFGEEV